MTAFTELTPAESIPLMRWRSRWARWAFEPYGIAIRRDCARQMGGRPVRYVDENEWKILEPRNRPYCHRNGVKADVWPAEREWRIAGDVDLATVPPEAMRVIVRCRDEIDRIRNLATVDVFAFN